MSSLTETGHWDYLVIEQENGVPATREPLTLATGDLQRAQGPVCSTNLWEGQTVHVEERVPSQRSWMLRSDRGWVCAIDWSKRPLQQVLMEVPVDRGHFVYRVVADNGV